MVNAVVSLPADPLINRCSDRQSLPNFLIKHSHNFKGTTFESSVKPHQPRQQQCAPAAAGEGDATGRAPTPNESSSADLVAEPVVVVVYIHSVGNAVTVQVLVWTYE